MPAGGKRRREARSGPGASVFAILCTLVVLTGAANSSLPAGAATQARPSGQVDLASQTAWVTAGGTFELRVDVSEVRRPGEVELAVTLHDAVTSRSQFTRTLDGRLLGRTLRTVSAPVAELGFDAAGALRVSLPLQDPSLPPDPGRLPALRPGVYPVDVSLRADGSRIDGFTTHLVRAPDDAGAPALNVAWVQPLRAPLALRPDGSVELSDPSVDRLAAISSALAGTRLPLTIEPVPETVAALATSEHDDVLADLRAALPRRQVLARPFVDLDVAAFDRLPEELAAQRAEASSVLASELGVRPDPRAWINTEALSPEATATIAALGVDRLIVPESSFEPLDLQLTLAQPFLVENPDGDPMAAVSIDPGLQEHFFGDDATLGAHHILADLAVLFYDAPGTARGVVIRPPDRWVPDEALLSVALSGIASSPMARGTTVDGLFDRVAPLEARREVMSRKPVGTPAPALRRGEITAARSAQEGFRTMVGPEHEITEVLGHLILASQTSALGPDGRRAYLAGTHNLLSEQTAGVRLLDSSYRLTAREGTLPLTLVNENPYPVTVQVRLESEKLEFPDNGSAGDHAITVELVGENTAMAIPVRARTPGAFQLRVAIVSPDGRLEVARARVTVRSTFVSGVGVVLSAGAGAFLLLWWGRHWRTARRDKRLVRAAP